MCCFVLEIKCNAYFLRVATKLRSSQEYRDLFATFVVPKMTRHRVSLPTGTLLFPAASMKTLTNEEVRPSCSPSVPHVYAVCPLSSYLLCLCCAFRDSGCLAPKDSLRPSDLRLMTLWALSNRLWTCLKRSQIQVLKLPWSLQSRF